MVDEQSQEIVSRLRGISSDDKSEMGKMKCRIDDQARLIMMLKKRNDEYIVANMTLDKHVVELERQIEELREQVDQAEKDKEHIDELKQTIQQLRTSNLQWEIKHDESNRRVLLEIEKERSAQGEIASLNKRLEQAEQRLEESRDDIDRQRRYSELQLHEKTILVEKQRVEIDQLTDRIQNLERTIELKDESTKQIERKHADELSQVELCRKSVEQQNKQTRKRLEEVLAEQEKLRLNLAKAEQLLDEAKQRFADEEERVNADVRVEQLQLKLAQSQQKIEQLEQEFIGYKNYTTSLLNKEKHLNERLQQLLTHGKAT